MKRIRIVVLIIPLMFVGLHTARAQDDSTRSRHVSNAIYGELGGKGLVYGFFYERLITDQVGLSIGFSSWSFDFFTSVDVTIIPFFASWYSAGRGSSLYVDAGAEYVKITASISPFGTLTGSGAIPFLGTGYCYRNSSGGFYFKIGPLFLISPEKVQPWANLSLGMTF